MLSLNRCGTLHGQGLYRFPKQSVELALATGQTTFRELDLNALFSALRPQNTVLLVQPDRTTSEVEEGLLTQQTQYATARVD